MVQELVKKFFNKEPNRSVNPEVVALGAAVQAGVLSGDVKDMLLLDVTPLSLGIETLGGVTTVLIPRNTTIPTKKSEVFSTASDNQTSVEVHVLQGERDVAKDNRTLGRFHLEGIPPAPRGVPQVEVTFDIDANGIVHVSAKDRATSKEQKITITSSSGLSEDEIKRMVTDAEAHSEEDKKRREMVEERNKLDSMIYNVEKMIKDSQDKLSAEAKESTEAALKEAKEKLDSESVDDLKAAHEKLSTASHKLAEELYKQAGPTDGQPGSGGPGAEGGHSHGKDNKNGTSEDKDPNIVDAEFEESN